MKSMCFNKIISLFFFFMLMINMAFSQEEGDTISREVHLQRSSILVSDLEKSLQVYRDILGFEVVVIAEADSKSYAYSVFNIPKNAKIKVATLNSIDQKRIINLKEVTGVKLPKPPSEPYMGPVLIKVDNIEIIMGKIKNLGLKHTEQHSVKGSRISYKEQSFIDPDGHLVAVYQLL